MIWEYKTLPLPSSTERQEMLSEMGLSGWELIGFEQGLAYFKRPEQPLPVHMTINVPTSVESHVKTLAEKSKKK